MANANTNIQLRPRTLPTRTARSRPHYREPDTESGSDIPKTYRATSHVVRHSSRPSRQSKRVKTYREESDSDQDEDGAVALSTRTGSVVAVSRTHNVSAARGKMQRGGRVIPKPERRRTRSQNSAGDQKYQAGSRFNHFKRRKIGYPRPVNADTTTSSTCTIALPANGIIPPWQTLPYEVLVKVMKFAAYPLYSTSLRTTQSVQWLVDTSRLCKAFHDAATSALLWRPPLLPVDRAHSLIKLLSSDQDTLALNYQNRVHSLHIEVKHLVVKKSGIRLYQLLRCAPLLDDLRIFHCHDEYVGKAVWAAPALTREKWAYDGMFHILDEVNIRLKTFEWNGRFLDTIPKMLEAHTMVCLSGLKGLTIVNLVFEEKHETQRVKCRDSVITALGHLPGLTSLQFRFCNIVDSISMPKLPQNLTSLEINNCSSLTSEALHSYLHLNGAFLKELDLAGNQVMDMGFTSDLQDLCPRLEQLHIDLTYDDCSSYDDRDPLFDHLLPNGSPTWPSNLNSIVVGPLRSLSVEDAEEFYTSLIIAGAELRYLRTLSIKTLLPDAGWRDRARLRSKWAPLFNRVFLTKKLHSAKQVDARPPVAEKGQKRSARLQAIIDSSLSDTADDNEDNLPELLNPLPRQNACSIVEFELSDQRPAKDQYTAGDFLDDEPGGDGDWNGRDIGPGPL